MNLFLFRGVLTHNRLRAWYCAAQKKWLVHDTNVQTIFSALNLTIIFIKPFTCVNLYPFSMKYYFSIKHFLIKHITTDIYDLMDYWLTDSENILKWPPITLWQIILIFMLFILSTGNKVLANSLLWLYTCITLEEVWLSSLIYSHRFTRCSSFWFLNPFEHLPVYFFLSFGWQHLHSCFLLFFITRRADLFLYFQTKCSSSL